MGKGIVQGSTSRPHVPNKLGIVTNHAFETLNNRLCKRPILSSPNFLKSFILQTDASDRGGAVLSQIGEDGEEHPVRYYSRKFQPREECYSTVEIEGLAIKFAISEFWVYSLGRKFVIQTDHHSWNGWTD